MFIFAFISITLGGGSIEDPAVIYARECFVSFRYTAKCFSYTYTYNILFQILFQCRLLQDIEYSFLCYTVGPCCLPALYVAVCIC